jgi:hypothetical protein
MYLYFLYIMNDNIMHVYEYTGYHIIEEYHENILPLFSR